MRITYVRSMVAVAAALFILVSGAVGLTEAQERSEKLTVILIDGHSISVDPASNKLVKSLLGLLYHLKEGQTLTFVFTNDPTAAYGPTTTDANEFKEIHDQVTAKIDAPAESTSLDLVPSMSELYNYLIGLNAGPDTAVHLITANTNATNADIEIDRLDPIVGRFRDAGWSVFNYTPPGTDAGLLTLLDAMANETGGESFDLTIPDGFQRLADQGLRLDAKGSLTSMGGSELSADSVYELDVPVVPGTGELNLLFFREDPVTSFRLKNPDGFEGSAGDRVSSSITELPHVVLWELIDPIPGAWKLEVRGNSGLLSAYRHSVNRFSIELHTEGAIPTGVPVTLVAAVMDGDKRVPVDGMMTATVSDPSGATIQYELTDDGAGGDSVASDGLFAATVPSLGSEGVHDVELKLSWPGIGHSITTRSSIEARTFPTVVIKPEDVGIIKPGIRAKVATAYVSIGGQPFSVSADDLTISAAVNRGSAGRVEMTIQDFVTADKGAVFDIFYTPESESLLTILLNLNVEYAGRQFQTASESIIVSSVPPPPTPAPQAAAPAPTAIPTVVAPQSGPEPAADDPQVPIPLIVALAVVGVIILALAGFWLSKSKPFGYLYTEDGDLVLDFSALRRSSLDNLVNRNLVSGRESGLPGFDSVAFAFASGEMSIRPTGVSTAATVRLNNQPVTDRTIVYENSLIGAQGRLYRFTTEIQTAP